MSRAATLNETHLAHYSPSGDVHVALIYPNTYHVGMSSLGYQVLYRELNLRHGVVCERAFLSPGNDVPVSLETHRPLSEFDILGFSISFELDYPHVPRILHGAGIPVLANERNALFPLVIAGGIAVSYNPEPLADFVDAFIIGEAEAVLDPFLAEYSQWKSARKSQKDHCALLAGLSRVPSVYVPSQYNVQYAPDGTVESIQPSGDAAPTVHSGFTPEIDTLSTCSTILTHQTEFVNTHLIEIARGCGRHCRFCIAAYAHRWPRYRSSESTFACADLAAGHTDRVGLVGSSVSDHPEIDTIAQGLVERGFRISVASLRAETVRTPLLDALASSGQTTLTIAPEVATTRLQRVINKRIPYDRVYEVFELALQRDIRKLRLYFLIGVPGETDADLVAIVEMAQTLRKIQLHYARQLGKTGQVTLVVSPLVPKPHTPFQWIPMAPVKQLSSSLRFLQKEIGPLGGFKMSSASARLAGMEGVLARGDRKLGKVLELMGTQDLTWNQAIRQAKIDPAFYAHRSRSEDETLPWSHLDLRVDRPFLLQEHERHQKGIPTNDCNVGVCRRCGAC